MCVCVCVGGVTGVSVLSAGCDWILSVTEWKALLNGFGREQGHSRPPSFNPAKSLYALAPHYCSRASGRSNGNTHTHYNSVPLHASQVYLTSIIYIQYSHGVCSCKVHIASSYSLQKIFFNICLSTSVNIKKHVHLNKTVYNYKALKCVFLSTQWQIFIVLLKRKLNGNVL